MVDCAALNWLPLSPVAADARIIGGACVGEVSQAGEFPWPVQQVRAALLDTQGMGSCEHWMTEATPGKTRSEVLPGRDGVGLLRWREAEGVLFGVIDMPVDLPASAEVAVVEEAAERVYSRIFQLLNERGIDSLWRLWNYLPDIHGEEMGLERYRRFNLGRARAFERAGQLLDSRMPAACALGVRSGPLSVAFLAGRQVPRPIENPRQVSAYRYPEAYGPQAPSFSRAALVADVARHWLFVSGTASIVGHESLHAGDVSAQLDETLTNIGVLVDAANAASAGSADASAFALSDLHYRVYLRRAADLAAVRQALHERLPGARWQICEADVCRSELLIEIEALGMVPRELGR